MGKLALIADKNRVVAMMIENMAWFFEWLMNEVEHLKRTFYIVIFQSSMRADNRCLKGTPSILHEKKMPMSYMTKTVRIEVCCRES